MSDYEIMTVWLRALIEPLAGRVRDDDRGMGTSEFLLLTGAALAAALVIAGILWAKLRAGANNTTVPTPGAP
jgi:hypothetical protein